MAKSEVSNYLNGPFKSIAGWCLPNIWQIIWPVAQFQEGERINNPVAEIGVFHGKFFIGLVETKGVQNNYAIDVFDMQAFNLDGAGEGNLAKLRENLSLSKVAIDRVKFLRADSMTLTEKDVFDIRSETGGFSFFSVDGCHRTEHTINDAKIAMSLTIPQGLVCIDDYGNPHWPGVQEGIAKLYFTECPRFIPLAFGYGKLFLCHISYHARLFDIVGESLRQASVPVKVVKYFGYDVLSATLDPASAKYLPD